MLTIKTADYIASYEKESQCPNGKVPEFAFIGRSNVGKSSIINMLTGRKALAKVSKTPGKTKKLNYFLINENWFLVDLPGIGYAKVSKKQRFTWEKMIKGYLSQRKNLVTTFMLVDASIAPQEIDMEFIGWMGQAQVPFSLILTKVDKDKKLKVEDNIKKIQDRLAEEWEPLPHLIKTSSLTKEGRGPLLDYIEQLSNEYYRYIRTT